jgi:hypothetical protein
MHHKTMRDKRGICAVLRDLSPLIEKRSRQAGQSTAAGSRVREPDDAIVPLGTLDLGVDGGKSAVDIPVIGPTDQGTVNFRQFSLIAEVLMPFKEPLESAACVLCSRFPSIPQCSQFTLPQLRLNLF